MWFAPEFEIGLWNAWIMIMPFILVFILGTKANKDKFETPPVEKKARPLFALTIVVLLACLFYPIFLPLQLGTIWLYIGFIIYMLGIIFAAVAEIQFSKAPKDILITEGLYHISRNPMYFGAFLIFLAIGIASTSCIYLILSTAFLLLYNKLVTGEERLCLEKYGEAFREYMDRTPRWIGVPKSNKDQR